MGAKRPRFYPRSKWQQASRRTRRMLAVFMRVCVEKNPPSILHAFDEAVRAAPSQMARLRPMVARATAELERRLRDPVERQAIYDSMEPGCIGFPKPAGWP